MLEEWDFLEKSVLPLLVSQEKDLKLSYYIVLLIAELTYPVEKDVPNYDEMVGRLRKYKRAFLAPNIISTLTDHLAK